MTTYDSTVGARQNIAAGSDVDATQSRLKTATTQASETVRKRPAVASATALGLAAVTAAGVIGGRRIAQARRPRSRWQRLMDRVR